MAKTTKPAVNDELSTLIPTPDIQVLERGLQNPFGLPSAPITLKRADMVCHWCNTAIGGYKFQQYKEAGYLPVRPEMLSDREAVSHQVSPDGYVTRGARQEEILMYTLSSHAQNRQRAKQTRNLASMNPHQLKREVVQAAGEQLGDQAADYLHRQSGPIGTVTDTREIIHRGVDSE